MNTTLSVEDPLADLEVTFIITLPAGSQARDERPLLVSAGVAGQLPVSKTGRLHALPAMINEVWATLGIRLQLANETGEAEIVATERVATEIVEEEPAEASVPVEARPTLVTPRPQAQNLSLF